jgi:hypothetical protein
VSLRNLPAHGTLALLDYDEYGSREIQLELHFAQTNYVGVFHSYGVTLTTLPNMAGLHPKSGPKELLVMDRLDIIRHAEWQQMSDDPYRKTRDGPLCRTRKMGDGTKG